MSSTKMRSIIYWVVTLPFLFIMISSVYKYFTASTEMLDGVKALGYPAYILTILGIAKALGVLAIFANKFKTLKEWAYAGFTFDLIGASMSHYFSGDAIVKIVTPIVILMFVFASYFLWKKK